MIGIDIQVSNSKGKVKGQVYSLNVGEGVISVLQIYYFPINVINPSASLRER